GCVARHHVTLFSALMKSGKSTLVGHLIRALQDGSPFAGWQTQKCRTLVVTEESQAIWRSRRDALGLDDSLAVMCRPMVVKPTFLDWADFLAHVVRCAARRFDLVVIDTLSAFAPWENENSAADVQATLTPLNQLTDAGLAVLAIHHIGKIDGSEGRAARGSTALAAGVDILLELRRYRPDDRQDRRRVLSGLGRFDEVPDELVIALAEDGSGYTAEGDRKGLAARELCQLILDVLPPDPPGWSTDEVHEGMPKHNRPRRGEVGKALQTGAEAGSWRMAGAGKPNDPRRFWKK
ncbi:MAG TPA: AAA family ATPase, partial [Gemmata sp.]|nr:AAA family ATPase [Gemmata sp.]